VVRSFAQGGDSGCKRVPLVQLGLEQMLASSGQVVVLARGSVGRLLPGGLDQSFALQASEKRVERAFAGGQRLAQFGECGTELIAVARLMGDERQDAELDDAAARLSEPIARGGGAVHLPTSVPQGTLYRTVVYA
jgi:hypothetical protein